MLTNLVTLEGFFMALDLPFDTQFLFMSFKHTLGIFCSSVAPAAAGLQGPKHMVSMQIF